MIHNRGANFSEPEEINNLFACDGLNTLKEWTNFEVIGLHHIPTFGVRPRPVVEILEAQPYQHPKMQDTKEGVRECTCEINI